MEGETHYERIIGGSEEEKAAASLELQTIFESRDEKLSEYDEEKTPEDIKIINIVEGVVDRMVGEYGGDPKPLPLDHIYILKEGDVDKMTKGKLAGGLHKPFSLTIGVERGASSKLMFASTLAHELFHLKSYKAGQVGKISKDADLYRTGLIMIMRQEDQEIKNGKRIGQEYFGNLEEAIVARCTQQAYEILKKDKEFFEESQALNTFKEWVLEFNRRNGMVEEEIEKLRSEWKFIKHPQEKVNKVIEAYSTEQDRQAYASGMYNRLLKEKRDIIMFERYGLRQKLNKLCLLIKEKSAGSFVSEEEVFNEFAEANFSGNYLPLARIITGFLGEGAFRKIAEEFSTSFTIAGEKTN